jgi:hypothetical protein
MEKLLLEEINKYRKLMGLSVISPDKVVVLEQDDEDENSDDALLDYMLGIVEDETYSKIQKILEKTDKTITEIINSPVLTGDELFVLLELAKIKNLQSYSDIIDNIYDTPQYKKIITDKYDEIINTLDSKLKSNKQLPDYSYASVVKEITDLYAKKMVDIFPKSNQIILDYYNSTIKDKYDDYNLQGFALDYSRHINDSLEFYTFDVSPKNYSGWKLYIYAENVVDVLTILDLTQNTLESYGVVSKAATSSELKKNEKKGLIIYLPYEMVKNNQPSNFFSKLNTDLTNYSKGGTISGAKEYNNKIHYLYEFKKRFSKLPNNGVKPSDVSKYFVPNTGGDFMKDIKQPDLFEND